MATIKQKKAAAKVVGNGGNITRAMIDAGYSPNTANTPQKLTESKGWKELMEKYLSDERLTKVHDKLLNSDDEPIQVKALDMGYKIKGAYAPEKTDITTNGEPINSDIDIDAIAERVAQELKAKKTA